MHRKILVVDDNAINRQMLINVLEKDYDIIEAENGREALELMTRNYKILSAVLMDIMMPEMDGYEVLRRVGENAMLSQIPIIMVTGSEDEASRVKVLSLGANDFILKPFNPEIVKHCLRNNIALRETASILNAIQRDKLTGLYNREAFFEKADAMIKDREPGTYVLSCFDIDNFKLINDQYGAAEGDRLLKEIGSTVRADMDALGGIAGRISADNFAAMFPLEKKYESILNSVHEKKLVTLDMRAIAFSVGRYVITDTALAASAIYDRAYIAKQSVKGRYDEHMAYFDEKMLQKLVRDQQIVGEMEEALAGRQFEVWFQPQYNHVSGALTGAEALVRWRHPQKGIIPPGEFIPLFEQNGFVYELDKYVWREACRYLRRWIDMGADPLPVSVNISRYDIFRADLIDVVTGIASEYAVPVELLRLEITESAFAKSTKLVVDIVKQLITLGFTVEIDDFGSGYSSLNTLKSVPAQVVKLDMRFLEDGDDSQRGGSILESIVRMSKWLGMSVIAEGVETREQGDFLKSIGCSNVQGYLYARPMPAADYEAHFMDALKDRRVFAPVTLENFDNGAFWNPTSMDSLIFNSFVGAACICEYNNGRIELLRATDKYAQMLGEGISLDGLMKLDLSDYMDEKSAAQTADMIAAASVESGEAVGEFLFIDLPGCPHETYVRSTLRVIANIEERALIYCISENITAQRVSEQKERQTMERFRTVLNNIDCGVTAVLISEDGITAIVASDRFYALLGYTREQYKAEVGKNTFGLVLAEDRERVIETSRRAEATGEPVSMEYRVTRRDGKVIWLRSLITMTEFEDEPGRVQLCTYTDITREKNTAQSLLDNLPCGAGICRITDGDARMVYLNRRYFTYFKNSIGMRGEASAFSAVHPDDRALLREAMRPAYENGGGGVGSCVVRIADGAGEYIPFRLSGAAMAPEEDGNVIYVTLVPVANEKLAFSEMLPVVLEKMMASSSDLSFVKDSELRYVCCSRAFARMVGFESEKDVVGKTDYDLFQKEYADSYTADDRRLMASGRSIVDMVESLPDEDGKSRYSSTSKYLLHDTAGNVIGLYGTGRDITQTRAAQERQDFLINNIPGGVAIYEGTWSTLKSIKLTYFSDGFCSIFGYTREEYEKRGAKDPTGLVAREYIPGLVKKIERLVTTGAPIDYIYKAHKQDGSHLWIHIKAVMGERHGADMTVNALLFDVTEHQDALERLRVSEEENRLALQHSDNVVCRYEVSTRTLKVSERTNPIFGMESVVHDVPEGEVASGCISPETADVYIKFYENIIKGEKSGSAVYQRKSSRGWRWLKASSSTIFSSSGKPVSAVVSFADVTESFEKDVAYKKWMQSLHNKKPEDYSLFRCNLSKKQVMDSREGSLLGSPFAPGAFLFDEHTNEYADGSVLEEDRERFRDFLNVDALLKKYYGGERMMTLEYRERSLDSDYRWLRLTVELVEYPHSADVEAYLLFENIDEAKRAQLLTIERAQTDPLTGVLNRTAFAEGVDKAIKAAGPRARHAIIMMDIDGFKLVNDGLGHGVGDQVLIDIAKMLSAMLRREDMVCRLGGDEFVVFLNGIPEERVAAQKAMKICELARRSVGARVHISGSVGIALCPRDGAGFEELYDKADKTLYHVKGMGGDNFEFYSDDMKDELSGVGPDAAETERMRGHRRRMLIVDDNKIDYELLANIFKGEFLTERAKDGSTALIRLRHYGSAISVVLLDLMMPGMDGFAVLEKIQQTPELRSIPVVVVSGADDRETSLRAIRCGASDYVMKPVDADVLRIRVNSAISKTENERLRAKNSFLELQSAESSRYRSVLDKIGLAVVEIDWGKSKFDYSPSVTEYLYGHYDDRSLWHILMTDLVADPQTVHSIQQLVHDVANDRERRQGEITACMKNPEKKLHRFLVTVYKQANEYGLTDKMILTFKDLGAEADGDSGTV